MSDDAIETCLRPLVRTEQPAKDCKRFPTVFDNRRTVAVEPGLQALQAPTLIVWGTDDVYFGTCRSRRLADTIPGTRARID